MIAFVGLTCLFIGSFKNTLDVPRIWVIASIIKTTSCLSIPANTFQTAPDLSS